MSGALIMLWLGTAVSQHAHQPDIDGWAVSRERRLSPPPLAPPLAAAGHDDAAADRIEGLLAEARTQTYSGDSAAAESALDAADAVLKEAPALPESAWLAAEILHDRAMIVALRDPASATSLEQRSEALAGPRAPVFSATTKDAGRAVSGARDPASPAKALEPEVRARVLPGPGVALIGPLPGDVVHVDGVEVSPPRTVAHGAHHVRVLRSGRLAWAGWIDATGASANVAVPEPVPCSTTDLAPVTDDAGAKGPVLCEEYVRARAVGSERIEVALCHHASCGVWLPWSRAWGAAFEGPMQPRLRPRAAPTWFLWTAAGVAAVIVGGFVLAEEGVFDRRGPTRETFTFVAPK